MAITVEDIKRMPTQYKVLVVLFVLLLLGYFYYFFFFQAALDKKSKLSNKLETLEGKIKVKEQVARRINEHKEEIARLNEQLKVAMARLPEKKEIPGLLTSVSQAGVKAGLEFLLFKPMEPVTKDFYAEIPIQIAIVGNFYNTAHFFESVANLPRIVNIQGISTQKASASETGEFLLKTTCVIKTYMFVEKKNEGKGKKKKQRNK
ncbi:MAG: type 4a pilus biogenesis protein PilO [Deltaproteobacteria bacterium]|nr:type 4a pilus biogenesis protein PilO [Deltaproteobacteria bacterium]